jgi:F0F1-type ATP synthase assembly protein I
MEEFQNNLKTSTQSQKPVQLFKQSSLAAGFGFEVIGILSMSSYIGYRLDEVLNWSPWLLLTGFSMGFIAVLYIARWTAHALGRYDQYPRRIG